MKREAEQGVALVVVLMAIAVLLPPTIILATLAMRWQRQAIDMRDGIEQDYLAEGAVEELRNRLAGDFTVEPGGRRTFLASELGVEGTIERLDDVVLSVNGRVYEGLAAERLDLDQMGVDGEGRTFYFYKKLELYLVTVALQRRPSLVPAVMKVVMARLTDGSVEVLGVTRR